ncbi:MAG: hypothetical protein ACAH88_04160 [Roseimicrobium sp.]
MRSFASILSLSLMMLTWHSLPGTLPAQRLDWKLEDFKTLTALPWSEDMKEPMAHVLTTIFHEPDWELRYRVLEEYLHKIPVEDLSHAFELCASFEGTQLPDDLVEFFLHIWAARDPKACWLRTKQLFKVVGIEDGWLNYDGWTKRPRITVQDWDAIKASKFRLSRIALSSFPFGVEKSSLPREERVKLLKEFADAWFAAFGDWPSVPARRYYPRYRKELSQSFAGPPLSQHGFIYQSHDVTQVLAVEVAVRRYIKADPGKAPEIISYLREKQWGTYSYDPTKPPSGPSRAVFSVWADADLAGMTRWVDSQDDSKVEDEWDERRSIFMPKGILMSRVDAPKREQWLAKARVTKMQYYLLAAWARCDPNAALEAAVSTQDAELIGHVARDAAYGPGSVDTWNACHPGLGVVRDFDFTVLPVEIFKVVIGEDGIAIMELWGEVDAAETARFGLRYLMKLEYPPRDEILRFFSGATDELADNEGVLDRTFCALRIWAVTKPDEMRTWLATMKDNEMRTALTRLLENPWGTGESAEKQ